MIVKRAIAFIALLQLGCGPLNLAWVQDKTAAMKLDDFQACAIAAVRSDAELKLLPRGTFKTYVSFDVQSDEAVVGAIMSKEPNLVLIRFSGKGETPGVATRDKLNDIAESLHRWMGTNCALAGQ